MMQQSSSHHEIHNSPLNSQKKTVSDVSHRASPRGRCLWKKYEPFHCLGSLLCICQQRETIFIAETRNEENKQQTNKQKETNQKIITESANICSVFFERIIRAEMQSWLVLEHFQSRDGGSLPRVLSMALVCRARKRFLGCRNKLTRARYAEVKLRYYRGMSAWTKSLEAESWTQIQQNFSWAALLKRNSCGKIKVYLIWVGASVGPPWRARRSASCRRLFWAFGLMEAALGTEICQDGWRKKNEKKTQN